MLKKQENKDKLTYCHKKTIIKITLQISKKSYQK